MFYKCTNCGKRYWSKSVREACQRVDESERRLREEQAKRREEEYKRYWASKPKVTKPIPRPVTSKQHQRVVERVVERNDGPDLLTGVLLGAALTSFSSPSRSHSDDTPSWSGGGGDGGGGGASGSWDSGSSDSGSYSGGGSSSD